MAANDQPRYLDKATDFQMESADTLLVRMPEEFHGWRRPTHQLLQQLNLTAWFEKHRTRESTDAVPTLDKSEKAKPEVVE